MSDRISSSPGLIYMAPEDVLVVKLFSGEALEHKTTGYPMGGGELQLPRIDFMISETGTVEMISIMAASSHVPAAVAKNAPKLALRPGRVSDLPDAVALPLFPEAMVVGSTLQPIQLSSGHRFDVLCAKSGSIVAFIVHDASNALRPELVPEP